TLTAEEKQKQKAGVDQEATKAKEAIDGAKDSDGVNQAKDNGINAIDAQHKSGEPIDSREDNQENSPDYRQDFGGHDQGASNASDTYRNQFPRTGEKTTFSLVAKIVGLMMLLITGVVVFYRKRKKAK
ncbi:DUF1542 domain-containing protein, partial [Enterococcus faecalis]|uniref:DUF1542 domain-containing protein n=1 Tax=Enterococcus faecalis TaxID=1351 RepID=UPI003D0C6A0D